jgi:hypothetical protein
MVSDSDELPCDKSLEEVSEIFTMIKQLGMIRDELEICLNESNRIIRLSKILSISLLLIIALCSIVTMILFDN